MKETYAVWVYLTELYKDREVYWMLFLELPSPPSKAITYKLFADDEAAIKAGKFSWDLRFTHIVYVIDDDVYWADCEMEKWCFSCRCEKKDSCCVKDPEHVKEMIAAGWKIEKELRGKKRLYKFSNMYGSAASYAQDLTPPASDSPPCAR